IGAFIADKNPSEEAYFNLKDQEIIAQINVKANELLYPSSVAATPITLEELSNLYVYDSNTREKISMVDYILKYSVLGVESVLKDNFIRYLKELNPSLLKTQMYLKVLVNDYGSEIGYTDGDFNQRLIDGSIASLNEIKSYIATEDGMNMLLDEMDRQRCNLDDIKDLFANLTNQNAIDGLDKGNIVQLCANIHTRYPEWNAEELARTVYDFIGGHDHKYNLQGVVPKVRDLLTQQSQTREGISDRDILTKISILDELTLNAETVKKKSSGSIVLVKSAMDCLTKQRQLFSALLHTKGRKTMRLDDDLKNKILQFQNQPELLFSHFDYNGADVALLPLLKEASVEILAEVYNRSLSKHVPFNVFVEGLSDEKILALYHDIENRNGIIITGDVPCLQSDSTYHTFITSKLSKYNKNMDVISKLTSDEDRNARIQAISDVARYTNTEIELVLRKEIRAELHNSIREVYGGNSSLKHCQKLKELLVKISAHRPGYKSANGDSLMAITLQEYRDIYNNSNNGLVHSDGYAQFVKTVLFACTNSTEFTRQNVEYLMRNSFVDGHSPIGYIFTHPQGSQFLEELLNAAKDSKEIRELLDYNTLIEYAVRNNNLDALEAIVSAPIFKSYDLNSLNSRGCPMLFIALDCCLDKHSGMSAEMLDRLTDYGADYNILDSSGRNVVHYLLDEITNNRQELNDKTIELLQHLISCGVSLSVKDKNGISAMDRIKEIYESYKVLNRDYYELLQKKERGESLSLQEEKRLSEHEKNKDVYRNAVELYRAVFDCALSSCEKRNAEIDKIAQCLQVEDKALLSSYRSGLLTRTRNVKHSKLTIKGTGDFQPYDDVIDYSRSGNGVLTLIKPVDKDGKPIFVSSDRLIYCLKEDGDRDSTYSYHNLSINFDENNSVDIERKIISGKGYYNYIPRTGIVTISFKGPTGNLLKIKINAQTGKVDLSDLHAKKIIDNNSKISKKYTVYLQNSPIFITGEPLASVIKRGQVHLKTNTAQVDLTQPPVIDDAPFQCSSSTPSPKPSRSLSDAYISSEKSHRDSSAHPNSNSFYSALSNVNTTSPSPSSTPEQVKGQQDSVHFPIQ
ncbi:MAG: hypothetical protein OEY79_01525, partial [Anaplasmataceae bacterium]|nr:hypothetical protein [Anaplasmataceae bacterium]